MVARYVPLIGTQQQVQRIACRERNAKILCGENSRGRRRVVNPVGP